MTDPSPADLRDAEALLREQCHTQTNYPIPGNFLDPAKIAQLVARLLAEKRVAREALRTTHAMLKKAWASNEDADMPEAVIAVGRLCLETLAATEEQGNG